MKIKECLFDAISYGLFRKKRFIFYLVSLKKCFTAAHHLLNIHYWKNASKTPAATAEPITPATFGPIAYINK